MRKTVFDETLDGITIDRVIRNYEYSMPTKHMHDEYEIYYLLEGERFYFIGQRSFHIKQGDLVFIKQGEIHKTGVAGKKYHDRILIEFHKEPFSTFFSSMGDMDIDTFFDENEGVLHLDERSKKYVESLLFGINSEIQKKAYGYRISVMMKLTSLLVFAARYNCHEEETVSISNKHKKVDEVASYIVIHYKEPLSLESLAETFFVNKCYLSRIFKEVTSFTVNEYINVHRIQHAKKLLSETDLSMAELAKQLGYESLTYFEKVFKTYCETSPLKYRKEYKLHQQPPRTKKNETDINTDTLSSLQTI